MSSLTFKALIDGIHFDPKKGALKIQLIATSYVNMDKLITLGPSDESLNITLESAQTKISPDAGDQIDLNPKASLTCEKGVERLKEAAEKFAEDQEVEEEAVEVKLEPGETDEKGHYEEGTREGSK